MEDASRLGHIFKDVFSLRPAAKMTKAEANTLRTDLVKMRKVDEESSVETWTPSKKRREMNAWGDYISYEIHVSKESDADFNLLMISLMSD